MKELSIKQKAQRYDEAIVIAMEINNEQRAQPFNVMTRVFPELKESEDERIRKEIISFIKDNTLTYTENDAKRQIRWLSWLEKQGKNESDPRYKCLEELLEADTIYQMAMNDVMVEEAKTKAMTALSELEIGKLLEIEKQAEQKKELLQELDDKVNNALENETSESLGKFLDEQNPVDKVEPKFHEGDWIVQGYNILKIRCVGDKYYCFETVGGHVDDMLVSEIDSLYHLWSIQDAKDGDILITNKKQPFIFNGHYDEDTDYIYAYCGISDLVKDDSFYAEEECVDEEFAIWCTSENVCPATKEQCDTLMKAMADAGYIFDFEKKELKKIEQTTEENHIISLKDFQEAFELKAKQYDINLPNRGYDIYAMCKELYSLLIKQNPAWSEEDENNASFIVAALDAYYRVRKDNNNENVQEKLEKAVNWIHNRFKFIKPQNMWKPSEEQLKSLKNVIDVGYFTSYPNSLETLYEQIKQL